MNKEDEINELKLHVQKVEKILAEQEALLLSTSETLKESPNIQIDFSGWKPVITRR